MRDLHNNIAPKRGISPVTQTNADTAIVSQIFDRRDYKSVEFLLAFGAISDANVTFTVLAEESDNSDMSSQNAIDDANLLGTEALATPLFSSDDKVFKLGFMDTKRYLRVTVTPSGNDSGAINIAGLWVGEPQIKPAANPPA